ncbi:four helix bundle protein [Patescibacteria group bacterium]|nr:four helix bundle protein [Patescibacteria group bacterium]
MTLPIIQHLVAAYKTWHEFLPHVPKDARYSLGTKVDASFIETIEAVFTASYLSRESKLPYLEKAAAKLDMVKFFLQIIWEVKALDNKKYITLSEKLDEIGRMLGGWLRKMST